MIKTTFFTIFIALICFTVQASPHDSSEKALLALKNGNQRFVSKKLTKQNYWKQIKQTKDGQKPFATILSCLDSRIPPEVIFDQGIGDIFVGRVAGNIEDKNMLGSFEFATKVVGTKLLVVMGHTKCGAVKGACDDVKMGNLTHLLKEIKPAIKPVKAAHPKMEMSSYDFVDLVAEENVRMTIENIKSRSSVINELVKKGDLKIAGAMYDVSTGKVRFLESSEKQISKR